MPRGHYIRKPRALEERFHKKYSIDSETGCWNWTGARHLNGKRRTWLSYGQIAVGSRQAGNLRLVGSHIASWMVHRGPVPDGLCVLHRCDNSACVNPDHLFLGTRTDNMVDKVKKGRQTRGFDLPQTRLSDEDIANIRAATGVTQAALAKQYGVRQPYISSIRSGRYPARLKD